MRGVSFRQQQRDWQAGCPPSRTQLKCEDSALEYWPPRCPSGRGRGTGFTGKWDGTVSEEWDLYMPQAQGGVRFPEQSFWGAEARMLV